MEKFTRLILAMLNKPGHVSSDFIIDRSKGQRGSVSCASDS